MEWSSRTVAVLQSRWAGDQSKRQQVRRVRQLTLLPSVWSCDVWTVDSVECGWTGLETGNGNISRQIEKIQEFVSVNRLFDVTFVVVIGEETNNRTLNK